MATKVLCSKPIQIVVVPDAEKENCPPFMVAKVNLGRPQGRLQPELVFRDITDSVHKVVGGNQMIRKQRGLADIPLSCRV